MCSTELCATCILDQDENLLGCCVQVLKHLLQSDAHLGFLSFGLPLHGKDLSSLFSLNNTTESPISILSANSLSQPMFSHSCSLTDLNFQLFCTFCNVNEILVCFRMRLLHAITLFRPHNFISSDVVTSICFYPSCVFLWLLPSFVLLGGGGILRLERWNKGRMLLIGNTRSSQPGIIVNLNIFLFRYFYNVFFMTFLWKLN